MIVKHCTYNISLLFFTGATANRQQTPMGGMNTYRQSGFYPGYFPMMRSSLFNLFRRPMNFNDIFMLMALSGDNPF